MCNQLIESEFKARKIAPNRHGIFPLFMEVTRPMQRRSKRCRAFTKRLIRCSWLRTAQCYHKIIIKDFNWGHTLSLHLQKKTMQPKSPSESLAILTDLVLPSETNPLKQSLFW
jgi:hypothetical protein